MAKPPEKPAGVILSCNTIVDGVFISAGEVTPYATEEDLPPNLQGLVADGSEDFFTHAERNIYFGAPAGRGRARRILGNVLLQDNLETAELEAQALPAETEEALQAAHDKASALAKAQLAGNQKLADAAYEAASQELEKRTVIFHVKRGGEMARVDRAKLKPGEKCFMKQENGEWVFAGFIDSTGEPPPQPIIT